MLVCDYIVEQIDGDYAHLRRVDEPDGELKLVARALLPMEITEDRKSTRLNSSHSTSSRMPSSA